LKDIRKIETLHEALWLLKDLAWCSLWRAVGMTMVLPTLVVPMWINGTAGKSWPAVCIMALLIACYLYEGIERVRDRGLAAGARDF